MKKYLINGALALLAGAFVVSCSEKESDFVPLAQQKLKDYDEVFKQLYGEIDPYQDWGFGSGKVEIYPNDSSVFVELVLVRTKTLTNGEILPKMVVLPMMYLML